MIYLITKQTNLYNDFGGQIQICPLEFLYSYFKNKNIISVDTETEGFDPYTKRLLTVQIGDFNNQFLLDSTIDFRCLKDFFEDASKTFIFQNAKFDYKFLYHIGIKVSNIYDVMLAEAILTTGYESSSESILSLKYIVNKYCNVTLDKSIRNQFSTGKQLTTNMIIYGANDVKYLEVIRKKQLEQIDKWGLHSILDLENRVVKVFARMEYVGIKIDVNKWKEVSRETNRMLLEAEDALDRYILELPNFRKYKAIQQGNLFFEDRQKLTTINWSSSIQKVQILNELGIPVESSGEEILRQYENNNPIISLLLEYNKMSKLVSSFGESFLKYINPVTKRIHADIWQILSTGRISMNNPNLQQIPSKGDLAVKMRSAFIPESCGKMIGGDYSGFELAIIAEFSDDPVWIDTLNSGGNLHSILCAMTFDIPIEDVKKPFPLKPIMTYRDVQKSIDFGLAYGMSKFKLARLLEITPDDAQKIIDKFFSKVPKVKALLDRLGELGKKNGYINTPNPFRRIRWYPKWKNDGTTDFKVLGEIERASKNMPIQGTNANCIKIALCDLQDIIDRLNAPVRIVLTVHDEIQCECLDASYSEEMLKILKETMINSACKILTKVKIDVDAKISDCWTK
jgi:DNA polymerase I-like protein with 3'-5' exonuclease and polymerase domains